MKKFSIGVDLGATSIRIAVVTDQGGIVRKTRRWTESQKDVQHVMSAILDGIKEVMDQTSLLMCMEHVDTSLVGIGVGVAGQINPTTGEVIFAPNLGWNHVPFKELLSSALSRGDPMWSPFQDLIRSPIPILVDNDVRVVTWGEYTYGAGKGKKSLICIFVGSGVGSGIILEGQILRGRDNVAGEVGHTIVKPNGLLCNCGNQGCLELYCGGLHLKNRAIREIQKGRVSRISEMVEHRLEEITPEILHQAAEKGDLLALELWNEAKECLSVAVSNLVTLFNPEMIILGGGVVMSCKSLLPTVETIVKSNIHLVARSSVQIVESRLGDDAGVLGAAAMVFDRFGKGN
ncbi:MAG: ROK family protein [Nitrospira sp.]|nr:ROK family protein [Nitrospira sp.]